MTCVFWLHVFFLTGYVVSFHLQVQAGAENFPQYAPGPGSWSAYEMQRAQGHR